MALPYEGSIITEIKNLGDPNSNKKSVITTNVSISCYCSPRGTMETFGMGYEFEDLHTIIIEGDYSSQIKNGNSLTITGNNAGSFMVRVVKPRLNGFYNNTQIIVKKV
jgi:hypothetical protein